MTLDDARDAAIRVLESEAYKDSILRRAAEGTLPPRVGEVLWNLVGEGMGDTQRGRGTARRTEASLTLVQGTTCKR
jgi:hypothetical protein